MINKNIETLLNEQIDVEFYASNLYLQLAAWFYTQGFHGFSEYMINQSEEERSHGLSIFKYLLDSMATVSIGAIESTIIKVKTPLDAFSGVYSQEQKVTELINALMKQAEEEDDYATCSFLQFFVDEQLEEEKNAYHNMQTLELLGNDIAGILAFDGKFKK